MYSRPSQASWKSLNTFDTERETYPPALTDGRYYMAWFIADAGNKMFHGPWETTDAPYSWSDADNWADFETAHAAAEGDRYDGVGTFLQDPDEPYCTEQDPRDILLVDVDDGVEADGSLNSSCAGILYAFGLTYAELSQSETGIHAFYHGRLPDKYGAGVVIEFPSTDAKVELYDRRRAVALTGDHIRETPDELAEIDPEKLELICDAHGKAKTRANPEDFGELDVDDEEIQAARETETADWDTFRTAIDSLTVDDVALRSTETETRTDGWKDWDPAIPGVSSSSGTRLGVRPDGRGVVYREGNHGGSVLHLIAWEEGIIRPGDKLRGSDFFDAVDAARDRGAKIPELEDDDE